MISNKAKQLSSVEHIKQSYKIGNEGQQKFIDACKLNNIEVKKSTEKEDIEDHIDFWIFNKGVDVKGLKKSHTQGYIVVEFKNVLGKDGSCSEKSKAEYIAFQFEKCFYLIRKIELLNYCRKNVKIEYVNNFNECYKKLYQRKDRKDLMTKLHLSDLKEFNFILKLIY